jgi:hypothetical protein
MMVPTPAVSASMLSEQVSVVVVLLELPSEPPPPAPPSEPPDPPPDEPPDELEPPEPLLAATDEPDPPEPLSAAVDEPDLALSLSAVDESTRPSLFGVGWTVGAAADGLGSTLAAVAHALPDGDGAALTSAADAVESAPPELRGPAKTATAPRQIATQASTLTAMTTSGFRLRPAPGLVGVVRCLVMSSAPFRGVLRVTSRSGS